jgi:hypothetical protein
VEKFYQMCDPGEAGSRLGSFFFSTCAARMVELSCVSHRVVIPRLFMVLDPAAV